MNLFFFGLFSSFKINYCQWYVSRYIIKIFISIFITFSEIAPIPFLFFISLLHLFYLIYLLINRPFNHIFNNFIEALVTIVNFVFSIFPILSYFDVKFSQSFSSIFSYILFGLPILSTFICWCFDKISNTLQNDPDDPTVDFEPCCSCCPNQLSLSPCENQEIQVKEILITSISQLQENSFNANNLIKSSKQNFKDHFKSIFEIALKECNLNSFHYLLIIAIVLSISSLLNSGWYFGSVHGTHQERLSISC